MLSSEYWSFNRNTGVLTIHWPAQWSPFPRELQVKWRFRPISIPRTLQLDEALAADTLLENVFVSPTQMQPRVDSFASTNLSGSGSITRGVIVGSNRDLGIESGLRFDLTGFITDDVYITASITDQNTFIQPDGTTQNLREFDQVFIRLQSPRVQAQFGDIDAQFQSSSIARFGRRLQGAQASYDLRKKEHGTTTAALAVIRGTFRTVELTGRDGIQGPYRLTNTANDPFIVVVAGTERVYLDGRLLDRGDENDYVIDYSIGEIYFTNQRIIRNTHRIRVEYQYLSSGFTRTLSAAESDYHNLLGGRMSVGATFIREADNISLDDFTGLSEQDLNLLRNTIPGENTLFTSGADSVGFRPDSPFALYVRRDTLIQNETITIYEFDPGNPQSVFRVQFTRVGEGQGSYRRSLQSVSGIVYEWVGPGQGSYEPVRRLQAPELRQVLSLRTSIRPVDGLSLGTEVALSTQEQNRYASDAARHAQMIRSFARWGTGTAGGQVLNLWLNHEYKAASFVFFDPIRDVEFNRKWDLSDGLPSSEHLSEAGAKWEAGPSKYLSWIVQHLERTDRRGFRNDVNMNWDSDIGSDVRLHAGYLISDRNQSGQTRWQNIDAETGWAFNANQSTIRPYYQIHGERREEKNTMDELQRNSFGHLDHTVGLQFQLRNVATASVQYGLRNDYEVFSDELKLSSRTVAPGIEIRISPADGIQSHNRVAYQVRKPTSLFIQEFGAGETRGLAVRSNTDAQFLNRAVVTSILYNVATESRSVLQETYLEVGPEFGQYVWIDVNGDGIPQLDEFFPEQTPDEGTFIRQLLPTEELTPVISLQFRWRSVIDPYRIHRAWFTRGLRYSGTIDIREQSETTSLKDIYLLRQETFRGEQTLSGRITTDQQLQLFRNNRDVNMTIRSSNSVLKNRLASGSEMQKNRLLNLFTSYRFTRYITAQVEISAQNQLLTSDGIASRNYDIQTTQIEPGVQYTTAGNFRVATFITFLNGIDSDVVNRAELRGYSVRTEAAVPVSQNFSISSNTAFRSMQVGGLTSATSEFVLTNGAGTGESWIWGMQLLWRVSSQLRATAQYNGRTVQGGRSIQTARVTVSANF